MFGFKRAFVDDIEAIQSIAYATWPSTYEPILGSEQVAYILQLLYSKEALKNLIEEGQFFYLLYRDNDVAGFTSFGWVSAQTWKLYKIYVLPQFQGAGAGKALLQFIIRKVSSLNGEQLLLNVNRFNEALHFYEKNGFIVIQEVNIDIGNGFFMNDFIMKLEIEFG